MEIDARLYKAVVLNIFTNPNPNQKQLQFHILKPDLSNTNKIVLCHYMPDNIGNKSFRLSMR